MIENNVPDQTQETEKADNLTEGAVASSNNLQIRGENSGIGQSFMEEQKASSRDATSTQKAVAQFRDILTELVSNSNDEKEIKVPDSSKHHLFHKMLNNLSSELNHEELVAKYASLLPMLENTASARYAEMASVGIKALQAGQLKASILIFNEVRFHVFSWAALSCLASGIILNVAFMAFFGSIITSVLIFNHVDVKKIYFSPEEIHVALAFMFGCLGSIISLLTRLGEFDNKQDRSQHFLIMYGFTLPIVGGIFASVLAAVLDANIITILGNSNQLFVVIGFLAGFSERFTKSILQMAENKFVVKDQIRHES